MLPKVEQSCYLLDSVSTSFCFSLLLTLLGFLFPSCAYSFHLSFFFKHHFQLCDPAFTLPAFTPPCSSPTFLVISISILFFFFFGLPLCSFFHLCLLLSNLVFNTLAHTPYSVSIFLLPLSVISLSLLFFPAIFYPLPLACCIIQMYIFYFPFPLSASLKFL